MTGNVAYGYIPPNTNRKRNLQSKSQNMANASSGVSHAGLSHAQSIQCLGRHGFCIRLVLSRQGNVHSLICA